MSEPPTENAYVTFSTEQPVPSSLASTLIIDSHEFTALAAGILSNILKVFKIPHHLYGFPKIAYGWHFTEIETLDKILVLTERLFRHALFHGTIANAKIAFMCGLVQNISLAGHTKEGGLIRDILKDMTFTQPFGLLNLPATDVDPLPYYLS